MSETGLPNPAHLPRTGDTASPRSRDEAALKIVEIRGDIAAQRRVERLPGEVTRVMPDGTVTIRTDKGEVDVKPRPAPHQQQPMQPGQMVEVEIPPGRPPRQVIVRPVPSETSQPRPVTDGPRPAPAQQAPPQEQPVRPTPPAADAQPAPLPDAPQSRPTLPEQIQTLIQSKIQTTIQTALSDLGLISQKPIPGGEIGPIAPALLKPDTIVRIRLYNPGTDGPPVSLPSTPATPITLPVIGDSLPPAPQPGSPGQPPARPSTQIQTPVPQPGPSFQPVTTLDADFSLLSATPAIPKSDMLTPVGINPAVMPPVPPVSGNAGPQPAPLIFTPASPVIDVRILRITADSTARFMTPGTTDIIQAETAPQMHRPTAGPIQDSRIPATAQRAIVVGMTAQSFPLVTILPAPLLSTLPPTGATPDVFLMQYPALNLPIGAEIVLHPITTALPHPAQGPAATLPAAPFELMRGWTWPVFDDALDMLEQGTTPQTIASSNTATLPLANAAQPGKVPPALLFFMAAVRAGDMAGWMGERTINALRRDGISRTGDILSRIGRDFSGLSRMADQTVSQDWKAMAFPFYHHNEVTKLHLFYRHQDAQKQKDKDSPDDKSTRFIFDLHLSQMGDLQLDGLMKAKRLDMVVRSEQPFSPTMQQDMRRAYHTALEGGGLHGDLLFQNRRDQFVRVEVKPTEIGLSA